MLHHDYVIDYVRSEVRRVVADVLSLFGEKYKQWDMVRFTDFDTRIRGGDIDCYLRGHFVRCGNKSPNFGIGFTLHACLWTDKLPNVYNPVIFDSIYKELVKLSDDFSMTISEFTPV